MEESNEEISNEEYVFGTTHTLCLSTDKIEFLKERGSAKQSLVKLLDKKGFKATFNLELSEVKIATKDDRDTTEALKVINEHIVEWDIPVEPETLTKLDNASSRILAVKGDEVLVRADKRRNSVRVIGMKTDVDTCKQEVKNIKHFMYMKNKTIKEYDNDKGGQNEKDTRVKTLQGSHEQIENEGACVDVDKDVIYSPAASSVNSSTTSDDPFKGGLKTTKFRCKGWTMVTKLREEAPVTGEKHKCDIKFTHPRTSSMGKLIKPSEVKIAVISAEIQNVEADAIVHSVNNDLKLNVPKGMSPVLLKAAGEDIQEELDNRYPKGLQVGEVAKSGPGRLKTCKAIYHGVLPGMFLKDKSGKDYKDEEVACYKALVMVILNFLLMASSDGLTSIAFPALGTGVLDYPIQDVVQLMFLTVKQFFECAISPIQKVIFVIYPKVDPLIKQLFFMENFSFHFNTVKVYDTNEAHEELQKDSSKMCETRVEIEKTFLQSCNGDIQTVLECTEVALILWRNDHFKSKCPPAISCLELSVQDDIYSKYGSLLERRSTKVVVDNTTLENKRLIHLYCKDNTDEVIVRAIARGLRQLQNEETTTIAIPVPSDGSRTWQPQIAADIIMKAVQRLKRFDHIVRVVIQDPHHLEPFLTSALDKCTPQIVPDVSHVFDTFFDLSPSHVPVGDIVIHVASDSEEKIKAVAKELKTKFGITLMYMFIDSYGH